VTDTDARELGRLFGFLVVMVAAAVVCWRSGAFARAAGRSRWRRLGITALFFMCAGGVFGIRTLTWGSPESKLAAFKEGCESSCLESGRAAGSCSAYCACTLAELQKGRSLDELLKLLGSATGEPGDPALPMIQAVANACQPLAGP